MMFCCCAKEDGPNAIRVDNIKTEDMDPPPKKVTPLPPKKKLEPLKKDVQTIAQPEPAPEDNGALDEQGVDVQLEECDLKAGAEGMLPDDGPLRNIKWWVVELPKEHARLGLELSVKPAGLCILNMASDPTFLANIWNADHEDQQFQAGDVITQVNAVKAYPPEGNSPKLMEEIKRCLKSGKDILMKVMRVQQFTVTVYKPGALGVEVKEDALTVTNMKPGLIEDYNKSCDGSALVATGDTVVKVNNMQGAVKNMLKEIAAAQSEVNLVFVRPGVTPTNLHD